VGLTSTPPAENSRNINSNYQEQTCSSRVVDRRDYGNFPPPMQELTL
jgi:hypothetical protein